MTDDSPATPADELFQALADRLEGTAYVVERTTDGLVVRRDLADEQWYAQQHGRERRTVVQHHVVLHEDTQLVEITDEHVEVSRRSGSRVPAVDASTVRVARRRGRIQEVSFSTTFGRSPSGRWERRESHRFDTAEAHEHIRAVVAEQGWVERAGRTRRSATGAAVAGVVVAGLTVALLVIAWVLRLF